MNEQVLIDAIGCKAPMEAVADLAHQVYIHKHENVLPGTKPRLREALEILEAGRQAGKPLEVTFAYVGHAWHG
jgi:hypothetical protein